MPSVMKGSFINVAGRRGRWLAPVALRREHDLVLPASP
jgi:hypothetical protein